tara:strand:+ start:575 stop:745 length:171 start_codon:yes stop_codon:yes gene_type:complete
MKKIKLIKYRIIKLNLKESITGIKRGGPDGIDERIKVKEEECATTQRNCKRAILDI